MVDDGGELKTNEDVTGWSGGGRVGTGEREEKKKKKTKGNTYLNRSKEK